MIRVIPFRKEDQQSCIMWSPIITTGTGSTQLFCARACRFLSTSIIVLFGLPSHLFPYLEPHINPGISSQQRSSSRQLKRLHGRPRSTRYGVVDLSRSKNAVPSFSILFYAQECERWCGDITEMNLKNSKVKHSVMIILWAAYQLDEGHRKRIKADGGTFWKPRFNQLTACKSSSSQASSCFSSRNPLRVPIQKALPLFAVGNHSTPWS